VSVRWGSVALADASAGPEALSGSQSGGSPWWGRFRTLARGRKKKSRLCTRRARGNSDARKEKAACGPTGAVAGGWEASLPEDQRPLSLISITDKRERKKGERRGKRDQAVEQSCRRNVPLSTGGGTLS